MRTGCSSASCPASLYLLIWMDLCPPTVSWMQLALTPPSATPLTPRVPPDGTSVERRVEVAKSRWQPALLPTLHTNTPPPCRTCPAGDPPRARALYITARWGGSGPPEPRPREMLTTAAWPPIPRGLGRGPGDGKHRVIPPTACCTESVGGSAVALTRGGSAEVAAAHVGRKGQQTVGDLPFLLSNGVDGHIL